MNKLWLKILSNTRCLPQTKLYLRRNAEERAVAAGVSLTSPSTLVSQLPAPGSKISKDELEDVSHEAIRFIIIIFRDCF